MRRALRPIVLVALCAAAPISSAQTRRAGPARETPECRHCIEDAQACLTDHDAPCALEVLDRCRQCGAGRSSFVPEAHHRGISTRTLYWSGATDEPTRAQLVAIEPALRAIATACHVECRADHGCGPHGMNNLEPLEIGFTTSGAASSAFLAFTVGTENACLAAGVRGHLHIHPYYSDHAIVVRYPLDAANWRPDHADAAADVVDATADVSVGAAD